MTDISANRTDLLAKTPGETPSDTHGKATERAAAQSALPVPGGRGSLARPSERPSEPVTAGLTRGPGAGPVSGDIAPIDRVRAAYARLPSEALRKMLEVMERAEAAGQR